MGATLTAADKQSAIVLMQEDAPLQKILQRFEGSIATAMRGPLEAPQLIRAALLQVSMTPALQRCEKLSIVQAVMQAAALGLMIGGPTGEAALVPRKGKAVLTPMVRGLVALAQRSKTVVAIPAHPVYRTDRFAVRLGSELVVEHYPDLNRKGQVDEDITHVYAIVITPSGYRDPHWMTRDEVEEIRKVSAAAEEREGPWVKWWADMALKTVVKRATKRYDLSPEFRAAVELDNRFETGRINEPSPLLDSMEEIEATVVERTQERTEALKEKINGSAKTARQPAPTVRTVPCEACGALPQEPHKPECPYA
jgi:recombination protein RecT